jgi:hypothetical protein
MHACNTNRSHVKNFHPGTSSAVTWCCILTLRQRSGLTYKVIQYKCHILTLRQRSGLTYKVIQYKCHIPTLRQRSGLTYKVIQYKCQIPTLRQRSGLTYKVIQSYPTRTDTSSTVLPKPYNSQLSSTSCSHTYKCPTSFS